MPKAVVLHLFLLFFHGLDIFEQTTSSVKHGKQKKVNEKNKKSLVLQEDVLLLFVLKKMLESIDYQCKVMDNIDSLNMEEKPHFDLVITDVLFKGHAPLEFVAQIKESLSFEKIYIVSDMELSKLRKSISNIQPIDGFYETPIDLDKFKNDLLEQ